MGTKETTPGGVVAAVWCFGIIISTAALVSLPLRSAEVDHSLRTPFDNTGSGHAAQWAFVSEASHHVPHGATFTVAAADRDLEMSLYMMAVGLLPEAVALPSSYYGRSTPIGERAGFVVEFEGSASDHPPRYHAIEVTGGWVWQRLATEP